MTDNNLSITTNEFDLNKQVINEGNPNKIKLRPESFNNVLNRVSNYPVRNSGVSFTALPSQGEKVSEAKPIMLNPEKFGNMINAVDSLNPVMNEPSVYNDIQDNQVSNETVVVSDMEKEYQEEQKIEEPIREVQEEVNSFENDSKSIVATNQIDEAYAQISQETEETLRIKEAALKAQQDIQKVEETVMQEVEESNQRLQAKSVEQADIQAKKEEALKRKEAVEKQITEVFAQQKAALKKARNKYLNVISLAEAKQDDIRRQAMDQTEANESKIVQIQEMIDKDYNMITETEEEIARKEKLLEALSNTVEMSIIDESELANLSFDTEYQEQEEVQRRVA